MKRNGIIIKFCLFPAKLKTQNTTRRSVEFADQHPPPPRKKKTKKKSFYQNNSPSGRKNIDGLFFLKHSQIGREDGRSIGNKYHFIRCGLISSILIPISPYMGTEPIMFYPQWDQVSFRKLWSMEERPGNDQVNN